MRSTNLQSGSISIFQRTISKKLVLPKSFDTVHFLGHPLVCTAVPWFPDQETFSLHSILLGFFRSWLKLLPELWQKSFKFKICTLFSIHNDLHFINLLHFTGIHHVVNISISLVIVAKKSKLYHTALAN